MSCPSYRSLRLNSCCWCSTPCGTPVDSNVLQPHRRRSWCREDYTDFLCTCVHWGTDCWPSRELAHARIPVLEWDYPRIPLGSCIGSGAEQCCRGHWDHSYWPTGRDSGTCSQCRTDPACTPCCCDTRWCSGPRRRLIPWSTDCDLDRPPRRRSSDSFRHQSNPGCSCRQYGTVHCSTMLLHSRHP